MDTNEIRQQAIEALHDRELAEQTCLWKAANEIDALRAALSTARAEAAQWLEMSERHCRRQEAAEAEADAMQEALEGLLLINDNVSMVQREFFRKKARAAIQAHRPHGKEK